MKKDKTSIGVKEAIQCFLFSLRAEGLSTRTHEYYRKNLVHFQNFCQEQGWYSLHSIDANNIRYFLSWVANRTYEYIAGNGSHRLAKPSPSRSWPYYKSVKRLFNWAVTEGLLPKSPVNEIHHKHPRFAPVQPYSREEFRKFLDICELDIRTGARFMGLRGKAIILLFLDTALRLSEIASINLIDLNLEQLLVKVRGKGNKIDFCPFSPKTAKIIVLYLAERKYRAEAEALWITEEGGALTAEGLAAWFTRLKKRANVTSSGRVHRIRHSSALQFLRSQKDSFLLQLFLRHEDLAMSRRYTQALKAQEAIDAHRNGASPVEGLDLA